MIHNKTLIEQRFSRALHRYNTMAVVQRRIAEILAGMTPDNSPKRGLEIGAGSGFLTRCLVEKFPSTHWIANDITAKSGEFLPPDVEFRAEDGETMELPPDLDIITTASTLQWFDNLPTFIEKTYKSLNNNGLIAISTFGKENFKEIRESLEYYTKEELEEIIRAAGFEIIDSREWTEQMNFETPLEVLRHIKATGVNAINNKRWSPRRLQDFLKNYPLPATLTFHPIIIIAKKSRLSLTATKEPISLP